MNIVSEFLKVSLRTAMSIHPIHPLTISKASAVKPSRGRYDHQPAAPAFEKILSQSVVASSGGAFSRTPPLSKAELTDIISAVRISMNSRLMRALSTEVKDDMDIRLASLMDRLVLPDGEASSKRHSREIPGAFHEGRNDYESIIKGSAAAFGVDPALVRSVIAVESNFNPGSTSSKGAMGLMQLMPATAAELGVRNAYDPAENIRAGVRYLKMLLDRYDGDTETALAAYNWGMGNVEKRPARMPSETRNYIAQVNRHYERTRAS
jgi:soluble lytic murein transglycosylase-like protein